MMNKTFTLLIFISVFTGCGETATSDKTSFPEKLVHFKPYAHNPVFAGTDTSTWDRKIRERGYILFENGLYRMWYTGYNDEQSEKHLGYATSSDGITWNRYSNKPIYDSGWVEDMCVIKVKDTYYMFAEGRDDIAHLLTSADGIQWKETGNLDIRKTNGEPINKGAFGTPAIWYEKDTWYLFYERSDLGIWLATSSDTKIWTNVQDDPVLAMGPDGYDRYAVAMDQVIKYNGLYYGFYHASDTKEWKDWSTNVAVSNDLIHWKKYEQNPIIRDDKSSGIIVYNGEDYRMYTMHPSVSLFLPLAK